MGFFFGLSAEFGTIKTDCERFIDFFHGRTVTTKMGNYFLTAYFQPYESNYWSWIVPDNLSKTGIHSDSDALEMKFVGIELLNLIKSVPYFRYCILGIDIDVYLPEKDLLDNPKFIDEIDGFVIEKNLYDRIGKPGTFSEFMPGYVWKEYRGEKF